MARDPKEGEHGAMGTGCPLNISLLSQPRPLRHIECMEPPHLAFGKGEHGELGGELGESYCS